MAQAAKQACLLQFELEHGELVAQPFALQHTTQNTEPDG
jgi:hypothetical protein